MTLLNNSSSTDTDSSPASSSDETETSTPTPKKKVAIAILLAGVATFGACHLLGSDEEPAPEPEVTDPVKPELEVGEVGLYEGDYISDFQHQVDDEADQILAALDGPNSPLRPSAGGVPAWAGPSAPVLAAAPSTGRILIVGGGVVVDDTIKAAAVSAPEGQQPPGGDKEASTEEDEASSSNLVESGVGKGIGAAKKLLPGGFVKDIAIDKGVGAIKSAVGQ